MKVSEIRELTDEELQVELERLRRHLFDLRAQAVTEKLEDSTMITNARRDIARLLTITRQRQIEAGQAAGATENRK
ncbi:MAG: 50S ribosomal protein L29 [Planctomycetota bacterium]|nr:50S ribosomal protein L29 [Planctomycetota bacterium]